VTQYCTGRSGSINWAIIDGEGKEDKQTSHWWSQSLHCPAQVRFEKTGRNNALGQHWCLGCRFRGPNQGRFGVLFVDYQQAYDEEYFYEALGLKDLAVVNVNRVTQVAVPAKKKLDDDTNTSSSTKDIQRHIAGSKDAARKPTSAAKSFSLGRFLFRDFLKNVKEWSTLWCEDNDAKAWLGHILFPSSREQATTSE
jgi:hypothetical protein